MDINNIIKQMVADEVRAQLAAIKDQARAYKVTTTDSTSVTMSWSSNGHARPWPGPAALERAKESLTGKLDKNDIEQLLL